jgi:hypothetical protein
MKKFASEHVMDDEAILAIMDGAAGRAIEHIYISGGCSRAALPSALVRAFIQLDVGVLSSLCWRRRH